MTLRTLLDALGRTSVAFDLRERLPGRGQQVRIGGLPGSSGAVLAAWLAEESPQRLLTIISTTPADAERWLSDLQHLTDVPIALYPQREALGEEEPHYEIAGERVETIAALLEGRLRILVTTARATLERTRVPASLAQKTLRLRTGTPDGGKAGSGSLTETATALEAMGYRRVPTVTEVVLASGWRRRS